MNEGWQSLLLMGFADITKVLYALPSHCTVTSLSLSFDSLCLQGVDGALLASQTPIPHAFDFAPLSVALCLHFVGTKMHTGCTLL